MRRKAFRAAIHSSPCALFIFISCFAWSSTIFVRAGVACFCASASSRSASFSAFVTAAAKSPLFAPTSSTCASVSFARR